MRYRSLRLRAYRPAMRQLVDELFDPTTTLARPPRRWTGRRCSSPTVGSQAAAVTTPTGLRSGA